MLNALLKKLNGHGVDVESLMIALEQLGSERQTSQRDLGELKVRRHQALLDDAPDSSLDKLERDIERTETRLKKIDLAEPGIRTRLTAAQATARKAAEPGFVEEYSKAFADYRGALLALVDAHQRQENIRVRAGQVLGGSRVDVLMPAFAYRGVMTIDHVQMWISRNSRELLTSAENASAPRVRESAAQPVQVEKAQHESLQHGIYMAHGVEMPSLTAPRAPDDTAPLHADQVRVKILRAGYSPRDDSPQCVYGQIIRMPRRVAEYVENMGIVEIIEGAVSSVEERLAERPASSMQHPIHAHTVDTAAQVSKGDTK